MNGMETYDGIFLLLAKLTTLNVRSKVIGPSESAAFATSFQSYNFGRIESIKLNKTVMQRKAD